MAGIGRVGFILAAGVFLILFLGLYSVPLSAAPGDGFDQERRMPRPGMGQRIPDREKEIEQQFEEICKYLELTKKQKKQAQKIFDRRGKESKKVFKAMRKGKLDGAAGRDSLNVIMANYREKFSALITEEQRKKLAEWSKDQMTGDRKPDQSPPRRGFP
ncbi:MAG TPA: hypothetical protein VM123_12310 [archaeon]|nr:hypothetical protein [archaeon]